MYSVTYVPSPGGDMEGFLFLFFQMCLWITKTHTYYKKYGYIALELVDFEKQHPSLVMAAADHSWSSCQSV